MDCPIYKKEKKERRDVWEKAKRRQFSKKENKEKERAMNAEHTSTWNDFDSSDEENDQANLCFMANNENNETILVGSRDNNVYSIQLNDLANQDVKCLSAISETSWLWHRRLGHMHMERLKDISSKELVRGLPKIKFEKDKAH
ncbi:hypothetical protein RJ640_013117 [Escallonia rubra]|uniref:GAG-pre-integrase domain-containing protein n=1 Tax=Escallonia rubra TaxID=112253 RepID=A0AA88S157_9ASTE|nr:hypothetical protein RJ640_013117 [Escallonia rubra]